MLSDKVELDLKKKPSSEGFDWSKIYLGIFLE